MVYKDNKITIKLQLIYCLTSGNIFVLFFQVLTNPASNSGTQTNKARSSASHNNATTATTQIGDNVKFEANTEVQAPNLQLQNLSVHDEKTFSQRNHDQVTFD